MNPYPPKTTSSRSSFRQQRTMVPHPRSHHYRPGDNPTLPDEAGKINKNMGPTSSLPALRRSSGAGRVVRVMDPSCDDDHKNDLNQQEKTHSSLSSCFSASRPIPIHKNSKSGGSRAAGGILMKRTASQVRLIQDEEMADFRDYVFFSRLVQGIASYPARTEWLQQQNDLCLAHIIGTRSGSLDDIDYEKRHQQQQHGFSEDSSPSSLYYPTSSSTVGVGELLDGGVFAMDW